MTAALEGRVRSARRRDEERSMVVKGKISGRMDRSKRGRDRGGGKALPYLFLLLPLGASLTPAHRAVFLD